GGLRGPECLRRLGEVSGAVEDDPAVELHDGVLGGTLGDEGEGPSRLLRGGHAGQGGGGQDPPAPRAAAAPNGRRRPRPTGRPARPAAARVRCTGGSAGGGAAAAATTRA